MSHLYTKYSKEGYGAVEKYSCNDLTTKDVIFFPVNEDNVHWSMFVVKDPQFLTNVFEKDNPTESPTFLFFDSSFKNYHSFETIGTNIIKYLLSEMKYTNHSGNVKALLHKYGCIPEVMYKYVLYYIIQYYFL